MDERQPEEVDPPRLWVLAVRQDLPPTLTVPTPLTVACAHCGVETTVARDSIKAGDYNEVLGPAQPGPPPIDLPE